MNKSCSFDSSGSSDPDGTIESYAWAFGDGATSTAASPTHVYAASGTYQVTLTVTDNAGSKDSATAQRQHRRHSAWRTTQSARPCRETPRQR